MRLCKFWLCRVVGHRFVGGIRGLSTDAYYHCGRTGGAVPVASKDLR